MSWPNDGVGLRVLVLGAAAGGGFPQWNCRTPNSQGGWCQHPGFRRGTQASLAVSADGVNWILLNASPDFRQQILATPALWPQNGMRHSPITHVVLTGGEIDQVAGLWSMRERQRFQLWAHPVVLDSLGDNPLFDALDPHWVRRCPLALDEPVLLSSQHGGPELSVTAFAVPGKVPLYLERRGCSSEGFTLGLEVSVNGRGLTFIPGCAHITANLRERLRNRALVFFEGTLWQDDELVQLGVSDKTAQRMGHVSVAGPDGVMASLQDLNIARKILIHLNTTNPLLNAGSPEHAHAVGQGWEVAYDGMEICL